MKFFGGAKPEQRVEITISNETIFRILAIVLVVVVGFSLISKASHALILVFMSFFLALALNAPVHWISEHWPGKRKGSRALATIISYLIVVAALVIFLAVLIPPSARQVRSLFSSAPNIVSEVKSQDSAIGAFVRDNNLESLVSDLSGELSGLAKKSGSTAISTVTAVGSGLVSLLVLLTMTFMMLVEGPRWLKQTSELLSPEKKVYAARISREMYGVVRGFVNGQVLLALVAAFMILPIMLIMNVPYAGALAVVVFVCGLIPMIGHFIGATIVTTVALFTSPLAAVVVLAYYILYQQIENYVVQPRIQANTTNLSPLLVFVALTIGVSLNGIVGGIVAIPVMGCIRVLVIDYLETKKKLAVEKA